MGKGCALESQQIERIFLGFAVEAEKKLSEEVRESKSRVIVLAGPTAVGKTRLSIDLAKAILPCGEIVSADSMQVYRHMDIGTAKPSVEEQLGVPHHLIDVHDVREGYNVVDFYYEARQQCRDILSRKRTPIIVGGSGFYLHAFLYGPPSGPPSVPELRSALETEIEEKGAVELYGRLKQLDPEYASTITPQDKQKIVRGLEIITLSGKKVSKLSWHTRKKPKDYDFRCWFLHRPKPSLYTRINQRCEHMVELGFLDEVKKLIDLGIEENSSAAQAIGYRQALDYLRSPQTENDLIRFIDEFKKASRNYAKRQFTWFRRETLFRWLDLDLHDHETAVDMIRQDYETGL